MIFIQTFLTWICIDRTKDGGLNSTTKTKILPEHDFWSDNIIHKINAISLNSVIKDNGHIMVKFSFSFCVILL